MEQLDAEGLERLASVCGSVCQLHPAAKGQLHEWLQWWRARSHATEMPAIQGTPRCDPSSGPNPYTQPDPASPPCAITSSSFVPNTKSIPAADTNREINPDPDPDPAPHTNPN